MSVTKIILRGQLENTDYRYTVQECTDKSMGFVGLYRDTGNDLLDYRVILMTELGQYLQSWQRILEEDAKTDAHFQAVMDCVHDDR